MSSDDSDRLCSLCDPSMHVLVSAQVLPAQESIEAQGDTRIVVEVEGQGRDGRGRRAEGRVVELLAVQHAEGGGMARALEGREETQQ